jgi:hypothetical protein
LAVLFLLNGAARPTELTASKDATESLSMTTQERFHRDSSALDPAERAHHKQLTDKLIAVREGYVESAKGYEFQYRPADVSVAELADWAVAEGKCCPFLDFHLDLEDRGRRLCLRLTGEAGIKSLIRIEFQVHPK